MTEATLSALSTRTEKLMVKFGEGVLSLVNMDKPARDLRALVKQLNVSPEQLKSATELSFYDKFQERRFWIYICRLPIFFCSRVFLNLSV